ncbi:MULTISPECIES: hypothetical protein [Sanguibacteroides]|uniref:Uncharacterized protein n=1 Tax=Sanguibacteroides justesenii TaxID=1547597 RepID=A0A0C3ML99_9PORP|nr:MULTISPECIES: hypothetical protein [Sanguibacteroides]KIO46245.1 hypothetical protein IE90_05470 [Sanguibacteroides justesenii]KIO47493.1 hypothetical protein BA92_00295 [Sanguibacteroides justesenii]PXZ44306.1 hypothetical protein DMB45_06560 [Sanguibacteroides justesenii]
MFLRIGIIGILGFLAVVFLNMLLEVIISVMMYGIGIFILVALVAIVFLPEEKWTYYQKYFQMKIEQFRLKLRMKSME